MLRLVSFRSLTAAALVVLLASPAFGQGKGRGAKPPKKPSSTQTTVPGTGVRQFGIWLDDASILPKGKGWTTFGVGYWRSMYGHQWDMPSLDAGWAMHRRVQFSANAPISHASYTGGYSSRGLGDVYLSAKVGLIDPDAAGRSYGVAVIPVVELLSSGSVPEGESRVHWALPASAEYRFERFRIYGAGGYFSRGSVFGAGAVEVPITARIVATGTLSHARSLKDDPLSDVLKLGRSRYDLSGAVMYVLTDTATVFGSLGRTISQTDANASTLALSGGISFGFNTVQTQQKRSKPAGH